MPAFAPVLGPLESPLLGLAVALALETGASVAAVGESVATASVEGMDTEVVGITSWVVVCADV
jgi:hypothetical protein